MLLARGPETIVNSMMTSNLSSILVRCIHLFLDLPSPYSRVSFQLYAYSHSLASIPLFCYEYILMFASLILYFKHVKSQLVASKFTVQ